jgi:hypothetical protein
VKHRSFLTEVIRAVMNLRARETERRLRTLAMQRIRRSPRLWTEYRRVHPWWGWSDPRWIVRALQRLLHTPLPDAFLNGITRQTVIGMLKARGVEVVERHILPAELEAMQQCWLTGTAAEVTPVGQMGDYSFEVGALTRSIAEEYEKVVRGQLQPA